jgi:UDP-N-acetylmuramoyl-L-alanyl-D-glutamate--2,6-diaminopimelate ligase
LRLTELLARQPDTHHGLSPQACDPEIAGLTSDSRQVRPGYLFAAFPGAKADGSRFVEAAIEAGAVAVLAYPGAVGPELAGRAALLEDQDARRRFALMAAAFYGRQPRICVAVTGTNGKTSTVQFARQLWQGLGRSAASIGTLGVTAPGFESGYSLTTPDTVALHRTLKELAEAGIEHAAMEASSHGLDQRRLDGVRVVVAGFTNLSRDHLDYHGTMASYLEAKAMLFDQVLVRGGTAVLNADIPEFGSLAAICAGRGQRVFGYGYQGRELTVRAIEPLPHGQRLGLRVLGRDHEIELPLAGRFQAWNALCALGLVIGSGVPAEDAVPGLARLTGVRGRLELVAQAGGAAAYVDYAHTPDALETVLNALRPHTEGRLVAVFGCGGDRDRGKRPVMGGIATRLADRVIVTDDNPRTEDAAAIRREVLAGCASSGAGATGSGAGAEEIGDRAEAIREAVRGLRPGDLLLVAGKGHEQGQIVGTQVRPFDDADTVRAAMREAGR